MSDHHPIVVSWDKHMGWYWRCVNCNIGRWSFDDRSMAELEGRAHQHRDDEAHESDDGPGGGSDAH